MSGVDEGSEPESEPEPEPEDEPEREHADDDSARIAKEILEEETSAWTRYTNKATPFIDAIEIKFGKHARPGNEMLIEVDTFIKDSFALALAKQKGGDGATIDDTFGIGCRDKNPDGTRRYKTEGGRNKHTTMPKGMNDEIRDHARKIYKLCKEMKKPWKSPREQTEEQKAAKAAKGKGGKGKGGKGGTGQWW